MLREIRPALVVLVALTLITGLVYPLAMTGIAEVLFPHQAQGSMIERDGHVVGSALIGQVFTDDKNDLLRAMCREDDPLSATDLTEQSEKTKTMRNPLAMGRVPAGFALHNEILQRDTVPSGPEMTHDR